MDEKTESVAALIERGNHLMEAGDLDGAKSCFETACQQDDSSALAYFGLGTVYYQQEQDSLAADALWKASQLAPTIPEIWNNLGACMGRIGKTENAIKAFRNVCVLRPDHAPAAMNLGRLLLREGAAIESERWLMQANRSRPGHGETLRLLAEARIAMGQPRTAIPVAKKAVRIDPGNMRAHLALGHAHLSLRNLDQAKDELRRVLDAMPGQPEALYYLAEAEEKSGHIEEARRLYDIVLDSDIDTAFKTLLKLRRALALPVIADTQSTIEQDRERIKVALTGLPRDPVDDPYASGGFTNFYLAYQGQNDRALQESIAQYYLDICPGLAAKSPHIASPPKRERYRVAVLSSFLRNHTVGYLCRGLIEHLDRSRFEVVLLRSPLIPIGDPMSPAIAATADEVIDLPDSLPAARAAVAEAEADLIYFPEIGMEDLVYFLAFARCAPVQVMGWGHPVTSGIPNIDAFLSVAGMEPNNADNHYSERLITLNGSSLCVGEPKTDDQPVNRAHFGMDPEHPVYLCAQSLFKVHPDFDATLDSILKRDLSARLYFIAMQDKADDVFLDRLARTMGPDKDRVCLIPRVRTKDFPSLLKSADVLLDVPHWSGGKTSLESLAVGTPIVHWPGKFMRGRHTLAFYRKMGVMDCVVDSSEAYCETAVRLVHDESFRTDVRSKIAERAPLLFNDTSAIDEIADVFERLIKEAR